MISFLHFYKYDPPLGIISSLAGSAFFFLSLFPIMLAKGQRPVIGRLSELLVSRCRPAFLDTGAASPTSHFDANLMLSPSPRGNLKNYTAGAVGLGIVAALDNSSGIRGCEILVKHAVFSPKLNSPRRPAPIPVGSSFPQDEDDEFESVEENYTYVTTRGPHESSTRVYYDGGACHRSGLVGDGGCSRKSHPTPDQAPPRRTPDFLRSCNLCGKNLEGKDIYMYR